jgi:type I restriction enzyme S subunit
MTARYPAYRDSGVEWLGEVPAHWEVKRLKHIVSTRITDGPHSTPEIFDEGVPFISAEAVSSGRIDFSKARGFISIEDDALFSKKYKPKMGDIFIVKSGATTGVSAIVKTDVAFNIWSPLAAVRAGDEALAQFVLHSIRSKYFQDSITTGWSFGTQQNIGMGVIENLNICAPPLPEQRAIAGFLDLEVGKIDALVEEQRRLIALLAEKRRAVISHAVTRGLNPAAPLKPSGVDWLGDIPAHWRATPLKHLADFRSGGTPSKDRLDYWDGSVPWISAKDLKSEELFTAQMTITETALAEGAAVLIPSGGVIILVRGMTLAHSFPVCVLRAPMAINQDLKALSGRAALIQNDFLAVALRGASQLCLARIDEAGHGTKALRMEAFTSLALPVPPLDEQSAILAHLDTQTARLDALSAEADRAVALLLERRAALISAAVTGKIDVRAARTETEAA